MNHLLIRASLPAAALMILAPALMAQRAVELPPRDRTLNVQLEDVYAVGAFDGADWETFGEIRQVAFDGEGNLHVLDVQTSRMVVVDPTGRFVRMWGQAGEGPGEWRNAAGAAVFRDGTVAIADMGHGAVQLFDWEGSYLGAAPLRDGGMVRVGQLQPDPRGGALFNGGGSTMMSMSFDGSGPPPELPPGRPIERIRLGDDPRKELFHQAWQAPRPEAGEMNAGGVRVRMVFEPRTFEPALHTAVLADGGLAVVDSSAWVVKILDADGREVRRLTRAIAPTPVTDRIRQGEIERQLAELESGEGPRMRIVTNDGGGAREMPREQVNQLMRDRIRNRGFYPEIAVTRRMASGWEGLLWLERARVNPDEPGPIDVFTAEGTYRGTIAPDGPRIPDAFGPDGLVAYIERGELDVPRVVVKRLSEGVR
ncbi:MAG: hypothetical protein RQ751_07770 [Longimicrobiales bacterium]|nr:hypothetical protein [Longimicrobiales bacterium]